MRIVLTENCTADGVDDLAAGWFDPADQTDDRLVAATRAQMDEQDALLLGRRTFEAFRGYAEPDRRHHRDHRPPQPGPQVPALDDAA